MPYKALKGLIRHLKGFSKPPKSLIRSLKGKRVTLRAKEIIGMERALDLPQDVGGDETQVIIPEAVESTKKARGNGGVFPARGGKGNRGGSADVTRVQGAN